MPLSLLRVPWLPQVLWGGTLDTLDAYQADPQSPRPRRIAPLTAGERQHARRLRLDKNCQSLGRVRLNNMTSLPPEHGTLTKHTLRTPNLASEPFSDLSVWPLRHARFFGFPSDPYEGRPRHMIVQLWV